MQKLLLQFIYSFIVRAFLKIIVGVKFDSAKFLLNEKQFIIVANHNSHLDTMAIMASLPSKIIHKVKPVAAADYFGKTKLKAKLSNYLINTLLIQRKRDKEHPENDPIDQMIAALDSGFSLIIFPEGTRGEPEVQQSLKPGIGYVLTKRPQLKYVPAYMKGMGKAMPKDDNLIIPFNSSLTYGLPTQIISSNIIDVLKQIEGDLNTLKEV
ncbi:MAG TPA: lysophospholipid acyltransferase family protein [Mucilaginibacter sp.]|nr:lysophospholipid acyltransferase family protein [Mucilaginibacter sp.]